MNILSKTFVKNLRFITSRKSSIHSIRYKPYFYFTSNNKDPQQNSNQSNDPIHDHGPLNNTDISPNPEQFCKSSKQEKQEGNSNNQETEENEPEEEVTYGERKKSLYIFLIASFGLLGGYMIMQMNALRDEKSTRKVKVSYTGRADIGGPWSLLDTEGKEFSSKDLKGYNYLIYFGFCNCPDICPNSLQKLVKATNLIKKMPEGKYIKLKTVFVTVDPDRDTYEKIKRFLALFDENIIGITGKSNDDPKLKDIMKKFRIYASKIELDTKEQYKEPGSGKKTPYTLDHTIITYLMDDDNNYLVHLGSNMNERDMASTIVDCIIENQKEKALKKFQQKKFKWLG